MRVFVVRAILCALMTFLIRCFFLLIAHLLLLCSGVAAPVPVSGVATSGNQLTELSINGNNYPQAQLVLPTVTAFAAGGLTVPLVPNGSGAPAVGARKNLLQDWLLDSGLINPVGGASSVGLSFSTPIINRAGADIVFMEINPGATSDAMQVTINGITQVVASASWGLTGFATVSADLYSTGTTQTTLAGLEAVGLVLNSSDIGQNVFGVGVDLSDFGVAANASVTTISFGSSGVTFDPVFIAGINGTGVPPVGLVSLPYVEPFDSTAGSFTGGASWAAVGGAYRNTISTASTVSNAYISTNDLSGVNPPGFFLSSKFTIVSLTATTNNVGFALFATNSSFSGGVANPYYRFEFRPGANVMSFERVGVNDTAFLVDTTLATMSVNTALAFTLEVDGRYEYGALLMDITVRQGALSETYHVVDTEPLTVGHFGYRNSTGAGGAMTVDCDDFTLRRVSTESFSATPNPFARPGVFYLSVVSVVSDVGSAVTLTATSLPAWLTFSAGTLSGTPPMAGSYNVTLAGSDADGGAITEMFTISVLEPTGVFISEFLAENDTGLKDEDGDQSDWIELFNSDNAPANVGGWWLSNDLLVPMKWAIPAGTVIPARGFLVVFASEKNRATLPLHTNFKLGNAAGNHILLSLPGGVVQSSYLSYATQRADVSFGRFGSYTPSGYLIGPTPGAPNGGVGYTGFTADTEFSVKRGFYTTPQTVVVTSATPGATLVYTTNGSTPTLANGTQSGSPLTLNIAATTTLRVAAFAPNLVPNGPDTQSYFFLEDIRVQLPTGAPPPGWPVGPVNGQKLNYGMDPDITGSVTAQAMKDALSAIPTISITTEIASLFDPATGIYVNPYGREEGFERSVSVELLNPDNTPGFHINAGLAIRGGFSRQGTNPKHNLHLYFRGKYGASKLSYPIFGDDGANEFDRIDLKTSQGNAWHADGSASATYIRDEWNRLSHGAMGHPYTRSRYYHLYFNGTYWGIYLTQERADSAYASSYFGGSRESYDVMKTFVIPHRVEAADGDNVAWSQLHSAALAGFATDAAYYAAQGLDANGQPTATLPLLDVDAVIDYTVFRYYAADNDAPVNTSVGGGVPKNFYAFRPRDGRFGFQFVTHDGEGTMTLDNVTGSISAGTTLQYFNPRWLSQRLAANAKYRLRFADRVQKHFFNGGAMDTPVALARWQSLRGQLAPAMLAESARWGDAVSGTPRTIANFHAAHDALEAGFLSTRRPTLISQLRTATLFPSFDAPAFSQHGGNVASGATVGITAPAATMIYYTLDGTDPQLAGSPIYSAPVALSGTKVTLKSRAKLNSTDEWSALTEAVFSIDALPASVGHLAISEIHYNPLNSDEAEFVELVNRSSVRLDLNGVHFSGAMIFTFGNIVLEPGARILVVENSAAFETSYGAMLNVAGQWVGALDNTADTIALLDKNDVVIESVSYTDGGEWPASADGDGYSLVRVNPTSPTSAPNWRSSVALGGNPGITDSSPLFNGSPLADADHDGTPALLEHFFNTSDTAANISPLSTARRVDGKLMVTFSRRLGADDLVLVVEISADLVSWQPTATRTASNTNANGTATEIWTANSAGSGGQFARLRVTNVVSQN